MPKQARDPNASTRDELEAVEREIAQRAKRGKASPLLEARAKALRSEIECGDV